MNKRIKLKSIKKIEKNEQNFIGFLAFDDHFVKEQKDLMIKRLQFMKNKFVNECNLEITMFYPFITKKICTLEFHVKYQKYDTFYRTDTGIISFDNFGKIKYSGAFIDGVKQFYSCDDLINEVKKIIKNGRVKIGKFKLDIRNFMDDFGWLDTRYRNDVRLNISPTQSETKSDSEIFDGRWFGTSAKNSTKKITHVVSLRDSKF